MQLSDGMDAIRYLSGESELLQEAVLRTFTFTSEGWKSCLRPSTGRGVRSWRALLTLI